MRPSVKMGIRGGRKQGAEEDKAGDSLVMETSWK